MILLQLFFSHLGVLYTASKNVTDKKCHLLEIEVCVYVFKIMNQLKNQKEVCVCVYVYVC